jgi:hypothetical protein
MSHHELDAQGTAWVDTPALCHSLSISRSTLGRWRRRELLRDGHHWVKKNPAAPRSDLLWHRQRCSALLASTRTRCGAMAESTSVQGSEPTGDFVLLHRDTGTALYATRATEAEIHRANLNLRRSGNRNRYVSARHLPHQRGDQQS